MQGNFAEMRTLTWKKKVKSTYIVIIRQREEDSARSVTFEMEIINRITKLCWELVLKV